MFQTVEWLIAPSKTLSKSSRSAAEIRQGQLTKPIGSLGMFESLAIRLAEMQNTSKPSAENVSINIFAADHGIAAEGVSAFPQEVTAQMIGNFAGGGAAICVAARQLSADLHVWNLGTVAPVEYCAAVNNRIIAPQTTNFVSASAMTEAQLVRALAVGVEAAQHAHEQNALFVGGEMGIGNTTSATAIASVLLNAKVSEMVGPGTGVDAAGVDHKTKIIELALKRHNLSADAPIKVLQSLGGFEIAALVGAYIRAAQLGVPAIVDGFICSVAALAACRINPAVAHWLIFSHHSAEPGYVRLASAFQNKPLLDLGMRLGEGSGAAAVIPLLRLACAWHNEMATFAEAAVSDKSE